jgi:hypothetical protein
VVGTAKEPNTPLLTKVPLSLAVEPNVAATLNVAPKLLTSNKFVPVCITVNDDVETLANPPSVNVVGFNRAVTDANSSFNNSKLLLIIGLDEDTESVPKISVMFAILLFLLFYF